MKYKTNFYDDFNCSCAGKTHMKVGNHNYFLSWREPWHKFEVSHSIKVQLVQHLFICTFCVHFSFRIGTGSTGETSAGTAAWILSRLTPPESSRCLKRSWPEVKGGIKYACNMGSKTCSYHARNYCQVNASSKLKTSDNFLLFYKQISVLASLPSIGQPDGNA